MPNDTEDFEYEDQQDECPTCNGKGTINPLTAPYWIQPIFTTQLCPDCDGTGYFWV